jgi:hypothetical protein
MLMKKPDDINSSEITPKELHLDRRKFIKSTALATAARCTGWFTSAR